MLGDGSVSFKYNFSAQTRRHEVRGRFLQVVFDSAKQMLSHERIPQVLAVMATAGLYDDSGPWLFTSGLPRGNPYAPDSAEPRTS
jgi:hypothetical protein